MARITRLGQARGQVEQCLPWVIEGRRCQEIATLLQPKEPPRLRKIATNAQGGTDEQHCCELCKEAFLQGLAGVEGSRVEEQAAAAALAPSYFVFVASGSGKLRQYGLQLLPASTTLLELLASDGRRSQWPLQRFGAAQQGAKLFRQAGIGIGMPLLPPFPSGLLPVLYGTLPGLRLGQ